MSLNLLNAQLDVIIFTEVKLKSTFPIQLYNIAGYERFACLRSEKGGGGVIAFIKSNLTIIESSSSVGSFEKLKIVFEIEATKFRLLAYYRAPLQPNVNEFLDVASRLDE